MCREHPGRPLEPQTSSTTCGRGDRPVRCVPGVPASRDPVPRVRQVPPAVPSRRGSLERKQRGHEPSVAPIFWQGDTSDASMASLALPFHKPLTVMTICSERCDDASDILWTFFMLSALNPVLKQRLLEQRASASLPDESRATRESFSCPSSGDHEAF